MTLHNIYNLNRYRFKNCIFTTINQILVLYHKGPPFQIKHGDLLCGGIKKLVFHVVLQPYLQVSGLYQ